MKAYKLKKNKMRSVLLTRTDGFVCNTFDADKQYENTKNKENRENKNFYSTLTEIKKNRNLPFKDSKANCSMAMTLNNFNMDSRK